MNINKNKLLFQDLSPLQIRSWKTTDYCHVELLNKFPLSYTTECILNERIFNCNQLPCGCKYQFKILFNQTFINYLCSINQCDIQFNNSNIIFQTRKYY